MPNYILSVLQNKCPRCRTGKIFKTNNAYDFKNHLKMEKDCPVCGQPTEIEVGFYYGSSYISYAFTIGISAITFVAWWLTLGFSIYDNRIFYWLAANALLLFAVQPYLMRVSRTGWLAVFVRYDNNWLANKPVKPERTNKDQERNW